jgi:hypothetical protein
MGKSISILFGLAHLFYLTNLACSYSRICTYVYQIYVAMTTYVYYLAYSTTPIYLNFLMIISHVSRPIIIIISAPSHST